MVMDEIHLKLLTIEHGLPYINGTCTLPCSHNMESAAIRQMNFNVVEERSSKGQLTAYGTYRIEAHRTEDKPRRHLATIIIAGISA